MKQFILALFLFFMLPSLAGAEVLPKMPPQLADMASSFEEPVAEAFTVTDGNGKTRLATRSASQLILLNFWATWCAPCIEEMPTLAALQQQFDPTELEVIAVSVDRKFDTKARLRFMAKLQAPAPALYWDTKQVAKSTFQLRGVPTTYLLRGDGTIIARFERDTDWNTPEVKDYLKKLITTP